MQNKTRGAAMALACLLVLLLLFSVLFLVLEADHDCTGEDCAVCAVLNACENLLRRSAGGVRAVLPMLFSAAVTAFAAGRRALDAAPVTPVSLRVKLSD